MSLDCVSSAFGCLRPVQSLSAACTLFNVIVPSVQKLQVGKEQITALSSAPGQDLTTLQREFEATRIDTAWCSRPLGELKILLEDGKSGVSGIQTLDHASASRSMHYRRISALLSIQDILQSDERAQCLDIDTLNAHFVALKNTHTELWRALGDYFASLRADRERL
ncbi:hypothetical protein B0H17DRAFT_1208820 [Mycena rosella]|uniref:Uncharacterized protein n=1 Tax=Mycena rosella TaxID=1033263 RepID=A0AAD7CZX1_MYCRO|nr:hypothetical protein B0H17DRAFT_1208820 [Mycena rosella]